MHFMLNCELTDAGQKGRKKNYKQIEIKKKKHTKCMKDLKSDQIRFKDV